MTAPADIRYPAAHINGTVRELETAPSPRPNESVPSPNGPARQAAGRFIEQYGTGAAWVLGTAVVLLIGVILAPLSLSAEHIMDWARSETGLNLSGEWPWVVFYSLDATAIVCVLMSLYCTLRGESGAIFRFLVWVLAGASAFANYRHSIQDIPVNDSVWFFPGMALSAPFLLEVVLGVARKWIKQSEGRTAELMPSFGLARWIPGVGAFRETYGSWRVARLLSIRTPDESIAKYRQLVSGRNGKFAAWKVLTYIQEEAKRDRDRTEPKTEQSETQVPKESTEPVSPALKDRTEPNRTEDRTGISNKEEKTEQAPDTEHATRTEPNRDRKKGTAVQTSRQDRDRNLLEQVQAHRQFSGEPIHTVTGYQIRQLTGCNYNAANRVLDMIAALEPQSS